MFSFQQCHVHLVPVGNQIQHDISQENPAPFRIQSCQDGQKNGIGGAIANHVENGSKTGGLVEVSGSHTVEGVEELAETVKQDSEERVSAVEGEDGEEEEEAAVADEVGYEQEHHKSDSLQPQPQFSTPFFIHSQCSFSRPNISSLSLSWFCPPAMDILVLTQINKLYRQSRQMADMSAHFRNIHLQNLAEQNQQLRRRISKLTEIEGYVELLVDKLQKAERKEQLLSSENGLLRQQTRELEIKFAQSENMHGDEMRYVFSQHDQLIQEKNAALVHLRAQGQKEQTELKAMRVLAGQLEGELKGLRSLAGQMEGELKGQRIHEQQLIAQYEEALIKYRNKVMEVEQDLQILYQSLEAEKNGHLQTKEGWITESGQFKNALKEKQARIGELSDQVAALNGVVKKLEGDAAMLADYNKQLEMTFGQREEENARMLRGLEYELAQREEAHRSEALRQQDTLQRVRMQLAQRQVEKLNLQTGNAALGKELEAGRIAQAALRQDNETYIKDNQRLIFLLEQADKQNIFLRDKVRELEDYTSAEIEQAKLQNVRLREQNNVITRNSSERENLFATKMIELKQTLQVRNSLQLALEKSQGELVLMNGEASQLQQLYGNEKQRSLELEIQNKSLSDANLLLKQEMGSVEEGSKRLQRENMELATQNHNMSRLLSNPRELSKDYVEQIDKMLKNFHEEREQQNKRHWLEKQKLKEMYEYELKQKQLQYLRQIALLEQETARNRKFDLLTERNANRYTPSKTKH